jgi:hypothetical protein
MSYLRQNENSPCMASGHDQSQGGQQPRALVLSETYLQQQHGIKRHGAHGRSIPRDKGLVVTIGGRGTCVKGEQS